MDRPKRVLVLDFDHDLLITLERVLEDAGFRTTTTWDVKEGVALLQSGAFDFFVIGDRPPQLDAEALLALLRRQGLRFGSFMLGDADSYGGHGSLVDQIRRYPCLESSKRAPLCDTLSQESGQFRAG
jgi:CheY-like chemotaxis protein